MPNLSSKGYSNTHISVWQCLKGSDIGVFLYCRSTSPIDQSVVMVDEEFLTLSTRAAETDTEHRRCLTRLVDIIEVCDPC